MFRTDGMDASRIGYPQLLVLLVCSMYYVVYIIIVSVVNIIGCDPLVVLIACLLALMGRAL